MFDFSTVAKATANSQRRFRARRDRTLKRINARRRERMVKQAETSDENASVSPEDDQKKETR